MTRKIEGTPIARHLIFVLKDGSFVIQWDNDRVQDVFSGMERPFQDRDFGHIITDYELDQMKDAGRVTYYDRAYVWIHPLPEGDRFNRYEIREETAGRVRAYYLNTTLASQHLELVRRRILDLGLSERYAARDQGGLVAVMSKDGQPFIRLADAENARSILRRAAPQLLRDAAVAFTEADMNSTPPGEDFDSIDLLDLDSLIASQTQDLSGEGRIILAVDRDETFLDQLNETITAMGVNFVPTIRGEDALHLIEDLEPDLVIMDLIMEDMHAWQLLSRLRANQALSKIPVVIVSDLGTQTDQVFAVSVAKVQEYITKPLSPGQIRQFIWAALKGQ